MSENPPRTRKPLFSSMAVVTAIATAMVSIYLQKSGPGAGFEGFGSMLMGSVLALLGTALILIFGLLSLLRRERFARANLIAIAICLLNWLWLLSNRQ